MSGGTAEVERINREPNNIRPHVAPWTDQQQLVRKWNQPMRFPLNKLRSGTLRGQMLHDASA